MKQMLVCAHCNAQHERTGKGRANPLCPACLRTLKRCRVCLSVKEHASFPRDRSRKGGLNAVCSECLNLQKEANPRVREGHRERHLRRAYEMTVDEWGARHAAQDGKCAICAQPPNEGKTLHVDHCHKTGQVRGLLCARCNTGLNYFLDDAVRLTRAASYVSLAGGTAFSSRVGRCW